MTDEEKKESIAETKKLRSGDIILMQTPSALYQQFRKIATQRYDHAVVVIDDKMSFHVSYPRAKLAPTYLFTHKKREPVVIRSKLNEK